MATTFLFVVWLIFDRSSQAHVEDEWVLRSYTRASKKQRLADSTSLAAGVDAVPPGSGR
jgi:hypothetical protein